MISRIKANPNKTVRTTTDMAKKVVNKAPVGLSQPKLLTSPVRHDHDDATARSLFSTFWSIASTAW